VHRLPGRSARGERNRRRKAVVGYSSQGPGRLTAKKPDISIYTHFVGFGVYPEDGGTSAACPVAAGVVAAIRSKYPVSKLSPLQLKSLIFKSAEEGRHGLRFRLWVGDSRCGRVAGCPSVTKLASRLRADVARGDVK